MLLFEIEELPVCCSGWVVRGGGREKKNCYSVSDRRKLQWSVSILWRCPVTWPLPLCPRQPSAALSNFGHDVTANSEASGQSCCVCLSVYLSCPCMHSNNKDSLERTQERNLCCLGNQTKDELHSLKHHKYGLANPKGTRICYVRA